MISLKEAINIFEKHKIEKVTNKNPFLFRSEFKNPSEGGELGEFSANNYILGKVQELKGQRAELWDGSSGKSLYHFLSKKYHHVNGTTSTSSILRLYGKKHKENNEDPTGNNDIEFERIYLDYYPITSQEMEASFDAVVKERDNKDCSQLFENYNYIGFYNPSINYTVMGDRKTNTIRYTDISVRFEELMVLIGHELANPPNEYNAIINEMLDKYVDIINKVWRQTEELKSQLRILRNKHEKFSELINDKRLKGKLYLYREDMIVKINEEIEQLKLLPMRKEEVIYNKDIDLDLYFKRDIQLQKEFNNKLDVFLCNSTMPLHVIDEGIAALEKILKLYGN
jgi:hypothetical protein